MYLPTTTAFYFASEYAGLASDSLIWQCSIPNGSYSANVSHPALGVGLTRI